MDDNTAPTQSRERLLAIAEQLFAEKGYAAVKLKDIAKAVGIAHTSLYHHVPGGKEALFVEVMTQHLKRHHSALTARLNEHDGNLRAQLSAIADWLVKHPPMDLLRLNHADLPAIAPDAAAQLSQLALEALIEPIASALYQAQARGEVQHPDLGVIAGGIFALMQSIQLIPSNAISVSRHAMLMTLIDAMLEGIYRR